MNNTAVNEWIHSPIHTDNVRLPVSPAEAEVATDRSGMTILAADLRKVRAGTTTRELFAVLAGSDATVPMHVPTIHN